MVPATSATRRPGTQLPGVVPGLTFALLAFAPAPQPTAIPATVANNSNRNKVVHLLLREGTPKAREG